MASNARALSAGLVGGIIGSTLVTGAQWNVKVVVMAIGLTLLMFLWAPPRTKVALALFALLAIGVGNQMPNSPEIRHKIEVIQAHVVQGNYTITPKRDGAIHLTAKPDDHGHCPIINLSFHGSGYESGHAEFDGTWLDDHRDLLVSCDVTIWLDEPYETQQF